MNKICVECRKCCILGRRFGQLPHEPSEEESILLPAPGSTGTAPTLGDTIPEHTHQNLSVREPSRQAWG